MTATASPHRRPPILIGAVPVVAVLVMAVLGMGPNVPLVIALGVFLGAATWCVTDLDRRAQREVRRVTRRSWTPTGPTDRRVSSLRNRLAYRTYDPYVTARLHESLVELIDDQLAAAHGIDRAADPETARALLGETLHRFVNDPETSHLLSSEARLAAIVTEIERL